MSHALRFHSVNGLTTATNHAISSTSVPVAITGGNTIAISVGTNPLFIRFGAVGDAVSATDGWRIPGGFAGRLDVPSGSTHLHAIREGSDTTLSVQGCESGI